jgi:hypothetical protein
MNQYLAMLHVHLVKVLMLFWIIYSFLVFELTAAYLIFRPPGPFYFLYDPNPFVEKLLHLLFRVPDSVEDQTKSEATIP